MGGLDITKIFCGWALQEYLIVGYSRNIRKLIIKINFQSNEENIDFKIE